jgi:hypothetical protein
MRIQHKLLLSWMVYAVVAVFLWSAAVYTGLAQTVVSHDHSYLSILLLGLYGLAEIATGYWVFRVNRYTMQPVAMHGWDRDEFSDFGQRVLTADFFGMVIEKIGILGTIVGVIWVFWPFMTAGVSVESMKEHVSEIFGGIAVAFIPTAVSFCLSILLDVQIRILHIGLLDLWDATQEGNRLARSFANSPDLTLPSAAE